MRGGEREGRKMTAWKNGREGGREEGEEEAEEEERKKNN